MEYRGYTLTSDNTHYKDGQHAVRTEWQYPDGSKYVCWHDVFTRAIQYIRSVETQKSKRVMKERFCVVKIHDVEKYAVAVSGGSRHECEVDQARANGIYTGTKHIRFVIMNDEEYYGLVDAERRGGRSVYEAIMCNN